MEESTVVADHVYTTKKNDILGQEKKIAFFVICSENMTMVLHM